MTKKHMADRILEYLAESKDHAVLIGTYTTATVIQQKHVDKFAKAGYQLISKSTGEEGFYLQVGKRKDYCLGCSIRFLKYQ